MSLGLTDRVRTLVLEKYVTPARKQGKTTLTVPVRSVRAEMSREIPMRGKSVVICQALQSRKLLAAGAMEIESVDGPPSRKSPTVVVHYKLLPYEQHVAGEVPAAAHVEESAEAWAARLGGRLRGLLKDELAAYGGGEAYLRWIRSEDDGEP